MHCNNVFVCAVFVSRTMQNLLVLSLVKSLLPFLPDEYNQLVLDLDAVVYGTASDRKLWEKCVSRTVSGVGFAAGALFAEKHFTPKDKSEVHALDFIGAG